MPSDSPHPRSHPNNRIAMALALLPGLSQVYLDHLVKGALFFAGFLTALNGIFLAANLQSANTHLLGQVALLALVLVWVGSAWDAYALSYGTDRSGLARDRGQLLRGALLDYLRDDLDAAALKLERAIELDVDWQDPDPLFHLGVVMLRQAERRALGADTEGTRTARRRSQWAFRTCLGRDRFGKWRREIRRETARMRTLLSLTGRLTMTNSERLLRSDTTILGFPELRESGALPRPNSESIPRSSSGDFSRARVTPRPFDRRKLAESLKGDTTVKVGPEEVEGLGLGLDDPTQDSGSRELPGGEAGADPDQTQLAERPLGAPASAAERDAEGSLEETRRDGRGGATLPGDGAELAQPPEEGIPATRLDVRPGELIADLLPPTRSGKRRQPEHGPPPTRLAARPSPRSDPLGEIPPTRAAARPGQAEDEGEELPEIELDPSDLGGEDGGLDPAEPEPVVPGLPPTRIHSRQALGEAGGGPEYPPTRINSRQALGDLEPPDELEERTPVEVRLPPGYRGLRLDVSTGRRARPEASPKASPETSPETSLADGASPAPASSARPGAPGAPQEDRPPTLTSGASGGEAPAPEEDSESDPAGQEGT